MSSDSGGASAPLDPERYVEAIYRIFLDRAADEEALRDKSQALRARTWSAEELLYEILGSAEFAMKIPEFLHRFAHESRRPLLNDSTQYGELQLLLRAWVNGTAEARYVVDVGARGRERSNSYDLLRYFGWRGLLVEANPQLIATIEREFAGLDIEIANCAVSDYAGRAQLTIGSNDDVSSLEAGSAQGWGETRGLVDVLVKRLPDLLEEHGAPRVFDLLSLDIEGEDVKVLNDLEADGRYHPGWVLIEASHDFAVRSLEDLPVTPAVRSAFEIVDQTCANLLLRRRVSPV